MKFDSVMPVRLFSGAGAVMANSRVFAEYGSSCLILTGGASAQKSGALSDCVAALEKEGIRYRVFSGIEPNPQAKTCLAAGKAAREAGADFIVGIGGGSPMDGAKAAAIYAANPGFNEPDIYTRRIPAKALPVLLIGTTAGTGSEVTGVSVLTLSDTGKKKSISGADCYAKASFCDYTYTMRMPADVTLSTALDAFAHAAESLMASTSNDLSALYAQRAIGLLREYILAPAAPEELTEAQRESLYAGSIYAGLAINITGTCFPHTVGYYLTENYGVPHGMACIAFMPALLRRAKKYRPEQLGAAEEALGADAGTLLKTLSGKISFAFTLGASDYEAARKQFSGTIKNFARTPGGFTAEDAVNALQCFSADFGG